MTATAVFRQGLGVARHLIRDIADHRVATTTKHEPLPACPGTGERPDARRFVVDGHTGCLACGHRVPVIDGRLVAHHRLGRLL